MHVLHTVSYTIVGLYILLAYISELTAHISELTAHISELMAHISELMAHISELMAHISELMAHISELISVRDTRRYDLCSNDSLPPCSLQG